MNNPVDQLECAEIGINQNIAHCSAWERAQQVWNRMVEANRLLGLDGLSEMPTVLKDAGELRSGIHILQRRLYFFGVKFAKDLKLRI